MSGKLEECTLFYFLQQLKQHPAFMTEFDPSQPLSPEMEALQALKYESESPDCKYGCSQQW
jgi:hypothetical protein